MPRYESLNSMMFILRITKTGQLMSTILMPTADQGTDRHMQLLRGI